MPDCAASGQSRTGMKKRMPPEPFSIGIRPPTPRTWLDARCRNAFAGGIGFDADAHHPYGFNTPFGQTKDDRHWPMNALTLMPRLTQCVGSAAPSSTSLVFRISTVHKNSNLVSTAPSTCTMYMTWKKNLNKILELIVWTSIFKLRETAKTSDSAAYNFQRAQRTCYRVPTVLARWF